jgi:membrane protease YdiL (CAAX protease family)
VSLPEAPPLPPRPSPPVAPQAGWYADPIARPGFADLRWWDGWQWTPHVAMGPRHPRPTRRLPVRAGLEMCAVILTLAVGLRFVVVPLAGALGAEATIAGTYLVLFGGMFAAAWRISHRYGTGRLRDDLGLQLRWADPAIGLGVAIGLYVTQIILAGILTLLGVPLRSNGQIVGGTVDRPWLFLILVIAGVIGAPIFEEIAFRGVLMASFASRWGAVASVGGSSLIFGLYHITPELGAGNVGMVIILTAIGAGLGATVWLVGRLGPAMFAHAAMNAMVFTLLWALNR